MNLIDKIKSGLSKGGAKALPDEPAIQPNHAPKNRAKAALIGGAALVLLGLICVAAWMWWGSRHKIVAQESVAQAPAKPISAPQAISPPVVAPSVASGVEVSQAAAAPPVVVAAQEVAPKESRPKESQQEMDVAVLSSGPELDAPPPSHARAKPRATTSKQHNKTAPHTESSAPKDEAVPVPTPTPEGGVDKKLKPLSVQQQADNEFRRANGLMQQGRAVEALAGYETALQLDAGHEAARQAMVVLLLENNRNADAERALQDGLKHNIKHSGFAMLLARIQVERDALWSALLVLQKTLPYAEQQADYRAFVAALLQRLNRHKEAVAHYQAAVQLSPNSGVWWMGLGISQQALQHNEEARVAFKRALASGTLNADLQAFVAQQLKEL